MYMYICVCIYSLYYSHSLSTTPSPHNLFTTYTFTLSKTRKAALKYVRDLLQCQKRPITVSKETYYSVKRDPLPCQRHERPL